MTLHKGTKFKGGYATVDAEEGDHYRDIAEVMTELGWPMNHSSARNHVLRVMQKFAFRFLEGLNEPASIERVEALARSPMFQSSVCDMMRTLEFERRAAAAA